MYIFGHAYIMSVRILEVTLVCDGSVNAGVDQTGHPPHTPPPPGTRAISHQSQRLNLAS